jgi:dihydroorotate dehydrogenase electron transfer subunit
MVNKIKILSATVVGNKLQTGNIWQLILDPGNNFNVTEILPGQFVCFEPLDPDSVMARPFSVAMYDVEKNTFFVLYKVVGKNTQAMTQLKVGDNVKFWGPLGQGFDADFCNYDEVWLVGGGIGVAPLLLFEKIISEEQKSLVRIFYGNTSVKDTLSLNIYSQLRPELATDDGSLGYHGFITNLLEAFLKAVKAQKILIITCGPNVMMQKVVQICQQANLPCYVILERIMACGINSCKGCSIKTISGMKRVCHDGPVFPAEEVIWDEIG